MRKVSVKTSSKNSGMSVEHKELLAAARKIQKEFPLSNGSSAGSVGAALRTRGGKIYTGICIDVACGIGFCAEHSAVAEMLKARETEIVAVVAVNRKVILPPCGRCRELMFQINCKNASTQVLLSEGRVVKLRKLLPEHWIESKKQSSGN